MAQDAFSNTMGAFQGAADMVFGFANFANRQRANDLAAQDAMIGIQLKKQEFDFAQATMPLKMQLLQSQVALSNLEQVTQGYTLHQTINAENSIQQVRALFAKRVAVMADRYKTRAAYELNGLAPPASLAPAPSADAPPPSTPSATGLGLPLPSNDPEATARATPQLLPPIDPDTGGLPQTAPTSQTATVPNDGPSAESQFAELRKSGVGFFSPSGPATPEPMGPPAPTPSPTSAQNQTPVAPAVTTLGPLALAQSQAIPEAVRDWEELKTMQRYMDFDKSAVAHYGPLLPAIMEMSSSLALHPEVMKWQRQQQLAAASQAAAYEALGKISAYGLDQTQYADVLKTIQSGIPIDPKALDERLKADHAAQIERDKMLFEKKLGASNVLTALGTQNPALQPIVSIGTNLAAGLAKEKGDVVKMTLSDQLARGDTGSAINLLKQTAMEVAQAPDVKRLSDTSSMLAAIKDASAALTELYDKQGQRATGPIVGRSLSNWTSDPVLRGYKVRLDAAQQAYQQAISGASVTEQEAERLRDMFPSITKEKSLNDSQIKELEKAIAAKKTAAEMDVYGPRLKELIDKGIPAGQGPTSATNSAALKSITSFFKSIKESDAAAANGLIKKGDFYEVEVNGKVETRIRR